MRLMKKMKMRGCEVFGVNHRVWALDKIIIERDRQDDLKKKGRFKYTCADNIDSKMALSILVEEVGEVARAINENDTDELIKEISQVGAISLAWLEGISKKIENGGRK